MTDRIYTEAELQERISIARSLARSSAWRDLLRRFTLAQRSRLANDMAHDFTITAIEIEDRYGHRQGRIDGAIPREQAIKTMDEERSQERAARNAGQQEPT